MIGARTAPGDWRDRTSGATLYVGDLRLPGLCYAAVVRSPHPHAEIISIDTSAAVRIPGVLAVITAEDFGEVTYHHHGGPLADRHPLARRRVRYVGEEVAAVAAESLSAARAGVEAVRVDYRIRPAVISVWEAMDPSSPSIHDRGAGHNISIDTQRRLGAPPTTGDVVVSGNYRFARQAHVAMETNGTVASWDEADGRLQVWSSTQSPFFVRQELAHVLRLTPEQVVTREVAVGGGFGAKSKICEHEALASMLSIRVRRPVRLLLDREEEFGTTKARHEFHTQLTTTATRSGRITGHDARVVVDNGAYNHTGPSVMGAGLAILASLYPTEGVSVEARLVDTNKVPGGQFRGYGGPQATFAVECQVDELADRLGLDPIELRLRNLHEAGAVTHAGLKISTTELARCLDTVRQAIGWDAKRALGGSGRGVGVAIGIHPSGARTYPDANRSAAAIDLAPSGDVLVRFGGADAGTGQRVILAQIAAQELGIDANRVRVQMMDSETTPTDMGAWSSRGTMMGGNAVRAAASGAADELRRRAAEKFGVDASDVTLRDGHAHGGEDSVPIEDLVGTATDADGGLSIEREIEVDSDLVNPATGVANVSGAYSFAAHAVEVEVDQLTGEVTVLDYVAAHDVGRAINPTLVEGQIVGGVVMGLGAALREELHYEGGRPVNPAYLHYPLPRAADLPPIHVELVEGPDAAGPYGAKGVGELGIVPVAAAVANAVSHATGTRIRQIPITPEKVRGGPQQTRVKVIRTHRLWRRPSRWWISALRALYPRGLHGILHRWGPRSRASRAPVTPVEEVRFPTSVDEAQTMLTADDVQIIGGGTDAIPARQQRLAFATTLVDVTRIPELRGITTAPDRTRIGAAVTLAELIALAPHHGLHLLADVAETVASPQIRAAATVAGNLCQQKRCWFYRNGFDCYKRSGVGRPCYAVMGDNRFHHAITDAHRCQAVGPSDLATAFLALDARIDVRTPGGTARSLRVDQFYRGPGETVLAAGELIESVTIEASARHARTGFRKLALTTGDFAVASAAAFLQLDGDRVVTDLRVVLGGVGPTPIRATRVEGKLVGRRLDTKTLQAAAGTWERDAHPLAGNRWKLGAATSLIVRAVQDAASASVNGPRGNGS